MFLQWLRVVTDCDHLHKAFYTLARLGGDEFAILLPQTISVDKVLLRIRQNREIIHFNDAELSLQLSLGAATAKDSIQLREAILLADSRMYKDKNRKRKEEFILPLLLAGT